MDKTVIKQIAEGKLILNFLNNTDKMGQEDRDSRVLANRLALLETYWENVSSQHFELSISEDEDIHEDEYFKEDFYQKYEMAYVIAKSVIE